MQNYKDKVMDLTKERNTHRHAKKVMLMHKQPKKEKV